MSKKSVTVLAEEAIKYTKEGVNLLVEIHELQEAIKNLPKNESYEQMVKEIIEKEKMAVGFIQQATVIQRKLIKNQHEVMAKLLNSL
jgi:hypothetical protein